MADRLSRGKTTGRHTWTLAEASAWLDPPIDADQLGTLLRVLGIAPAGFRNTGKRGRPAAEWDVAAIIQVHAAVARWLGDRDTPADGNGLTSGNAALSGLALP